MRKYFTIFTIALVLIMSTMTVLAGDIPEAFLHSDDAEIFFGEVIAYHPDKENPTVVVSPVAMIKGDSNKEGTQQIYYNPNTVGDFKVYLDHIYLFTYFDEANPTDIFKVTTYDTSTLKLKHVEGDMWERFEKYLNEGQYGVARIEGRTPQELPAFAVVLLCILGVGAVSAIVVIIVLGMKKKHQS